MVLAFIDNGISAAMAQNSEMMLQKGESYHWDLAVVSGIFLISSCFGMPMMTAATPFCNDHVYALADKEKIVLDGHVSYRVTYAREHRIAIIFTHALIGCSILALPIPLQWIPVPALYGVFLFMATTGTEGNQFFDRFMLYLTQPNKYPSRPYVRKVPRKIMHIYTAVQTLCWAILCVIAFVPQQWVNLMFPVVLAVLVVVRNFILPLFIIPKYLYVLD
jgi:sodium borate transporter 11